MYLQIPCPSNKYSFPVKDDFKKLFVLYKKYSNKTLVEILY